MSTTFRRGSHATARHRTEWIEAGPADGPLMILLHGWPEIGIVWRHQLDHFAERGWRCVAPDMRGYGGSTVHDAIADYALREIVTDMIELHDALGARPAIWIGHDWGSAVAWSIASHHAQRCRGVVNLCVPYLARGMTLDVLVSLVDRALYPVDRYPIGQFDYWLYQREHFAQSAAELGADVTATINVLYRHASADAMGRPARLAAVRANGGWFGAARRAPSMPRDERLLRADDHAAIVGAFEKTGFAGGNAWYLNDAANAAYAAEAPAFGRIELPALFLHAEWDMTCETVSSRLADPMRADCARLSEVTIAAGHEVMLERPAEVNAAIEQWLDAITRS